jgi:predicted Zn-dependent protease
MPFPGRTRLQLTLSLDRLLADNKRKAEIDPAAADRAHKIASSASPYHATVLIVRATYLMNSGKWKQSDELERIVRQLETNSRAYPQSWMVIALYYGATGNREKASRALVAGMTAGADLKQMQGIANNINLELTEK